MPMTTTFTKNDLVRFLYGEVNEDERLDMIESQKSDMELQSSLDKIQEAKELLEGFSMSMPNSLVSKILYISKNYQTHILK